MKILYGVQATGRGHISRALAMAEALSEQPVSVTWLFSGRPREALFDMQPFGCYQHRRGLSFSTAKGRIQPLKTVLQNNLFRFVGDVVSLDLTPYDLVVTDFEPITAWAARLRGVRCIGIGHQYAFGPGTPTPGGYPLSRFIMRHFAPVTRPLGLHWHPYAANVLPPILDLPELPRRDDGFFLVYLPFEDQQAVTELLNSLDSFRFVQFSNGLPPGQVGNVSLHPSSTCAFKQQLAACRGVICNSGFELISECLQWQKPLLTKPLAGQVEQLSNAESLRQLGYAQVVHSLQRDALTAWLERPKRPKASGFGNVANRLSCWLASGAKASVATLGADLWHGDIRMQSTTTSGALTRLQSTAINP